MMKRPLTISAKFVPLMMSPKCLRDDLNASKANAMFIAPTLRQYSAASSTARGRYTAI